MRVTRKLAGAAAIVLATAGVAAAATSPAGVFKGTLSNAGSAQLGRTDTFHVQATFTKGKLTRLYGKGDWIPYDKAKTTSTYCGSANVYDSKGTSTITEKPAPKGSDFLFVVTSNEKGFGWLTVTLKGSWDSATKATTEVRFYEHKMPDKGHCDSGQLPLKLKKS